MKFYQYIFNITNYRSGESNNIKVFNIKRKYPRVRKYKYSRERETWLMQKIHKLWLDGYAVPDFTRGICYGIYPEHRDEDPTLTQEQEWPFK